ncbi:MAG: hypothetical protein Q9163_000088 [Psora crenata]
MTSPHIAPSPGTPVAVKLTVNGNDELRRFKLNLKDLEATVLSDKLRHLLAIPESKLVIIERYSDSSASFVTLDSRNTSVYKQLYRAAKAKGKLRLRITVNDTADPKAEVSETPVAANDCLPSRSYVDPYVSEPESTDQCPSSRISTLEDMKTLSAAPSADTLTLSPKSDSGPKSERPPSYFWPVSNSAPFSNATKAAFERSPDADQNTETKVEEESDEAPMPRSFSDREHCLAQLAAIQLRYAAKSTFQEAHTPAHFSICCNRCDKTIPDAHWHCGICDGGDYDLCEECVMKGFSCENDKHWLITRYVKQGKVINSTTEIISPKRSTKVEEKKEVAGAFASHVKREPIHNLERTCNSCVQVFHESKFVTCTTCDDYDLCIPCHVSMKHGHHPGHSFEPAVNGMVLDPMATKLLGAGRGLHLWATCDGCHQAQSIYGVRHKCFNCPDWDYCSKCSLTAQDTHPGHHLIALHEQIVPQYQPRQMHHGICCDGPLCQGKSTYILGDRYKCAVCHDTDFCAKCEALPGLKHNRTHPLLKFKTPVRNASVTTYGEKGNGDAMRPMGDQPPATTSRSTETTPIAPSANAATQVQTVAEIKPTEAAERGEPKIIQDKPRVSVTTKPLQATFVRDTIADGSVIAPNTQFTQTWTLRNQGPRPWPAGCSVCFVGGDSMLNVDSNQPSSMGQLNKALSTNAIDRPVDRGEEIDFTVTMRTAEREGKAISYWRLKTADGTPFGHRVWCDVNIRKTPKVQEVVEGNKGQSSGANTEEPKAKPDTRQQEQDSKTGQMIFPTLEKESPIASIHASEPSSAVLAGATVLSPAAQALLADVESLELDDNDGSSEEGFLTDEEYELIASGDEIEVAKNGKK